MQTHMDILPEAIMKCLKPLMLSGNKRSHVLKQTCSEKFQVCLSTYDLLLPPSIKGLMVGNDLFLQYFHLKNSFNNFGLNMLRNIRIHITRRFL